MWHAQPSLTRTSPALWTFSRICSRRCATCARQKPRNTNFVSNPNYSVWTPPPSSSAFPSFPGLHSVKPKAASKYTPCWIMTALSRLLQPSPRPRPMKAVLPIHWSCQRAPSWSFINYLWFRTPGAKNIFFVTRLKRNTVYKLLEHRPVNRKTGITSDHIIAVNSQGKTLRLRRIGYREPETGKRYEFLTNHFRLSAKTIADLYKERWQIELFFKEIKQNLRIKTFVGNSENAVLIQIYTALTVYLLLAYQKFLSRLGLSVQQLFQLIQLNLLGAASLEELLSPQRRKIDNPCRLSLLDLGA